MPGAVVNLDAEVVLTQRLLSSLVARPRITPQLLTKPPVRFLRDVFIEVSKATGCGEGLFTSTEVETMAESRENKFFFLTVLLHFVANVVDDLGLLAQVRISKVAAGLEPEKTNLLLQRLYEAATSGICRSRWPTAVPAARTAAARMDHSDMIGVPENELDGSYTNPLPQGYTAKAEAVGTVEEWSERLMAEGFSGREDGRLNRLAAEVANFQNSLRRLRQVAADGGHLASMSEGEFAQVILRHTWPVALLQMPRHRLSFENGANGHSTPAGERSPSLGSTKLPPLRNDVPCLSTASASSSSRQNGSQTPSCSVEDRVAAALVPRPPGTPCGEGSSSPFPRPNRRSVHRSSLPSDLNRPEPAQADLSKAFTDAAVVVSKEHHHKQQLEEKKEERRRISNVAELAGGMESMASLLDLMHSKTGQELLDGVERIVKERKIDLRQILEPSSQAVPLHYAAAVVKSPALLKLLIDCGADVRARFGGASEWHGLEPDDDVLEFIKGQRKACQKSGINCDRWIAMEEIVKSEIDRMRGWQQGRRNTRTYSLKKSVNQLEEMNVLKKDEVSSDDSDTEVVAMENVQSPKKKKNKVVKEGDEVMRSLYAAKAGCLCEHYECHPSEIFEMLTKIGEGAFGAVWKSMHRTTGHLRAIKQMQKLHIDDLSLWSEISVMRQLDHPHIMKLFSTFEDKTSVFIVSELCSGGQLFDAIIGAGSLSERKAALMMKQILQAVTYIHKRFIAHRDLKPENFMLAAKARLEDVHIKLIDFGTAKRFDLEDMTTKVCTVHYVAPELLKTQPIPYTEKCDTWSCGVILYVMLCGSPPFSGDTDMEVLKKVKKSKLSFLPVNLWDHVSHDAKSLIGCMLNAKVPDRLTAEEACKDKWIDKLAPNSTEENLANTNNRILNKMRTFSCYNKLKKVALQVIAQNMPEETLEFLQKQFVSMDTNHCGAITVNQMELAFHEIECDEGMKMDLIYMMHEMAADSGEINYTQFLAANIERSAYLKEEACKAAFSLFDVDGDGEISRLDLEVLFACGEEKAPSEGATGACAIVGLERAEIERIMRESDVDGNGSISFDEFVAMMANKNVVSHAMLGSEKDAAQAGQLAGMARQRRDSFMHGSQAQSQAKIGALSKMTLSGEKPKAVAAEVTLQMSKQENVKGGEENLQQRITKFNEAQVVRAAELDAEDAEREARKPKVEAGIKKYATQVLSKFTSNEKESPTAQTRLRLSVRPDDPGEQQMQLQQQRQSISTASISSMASGPPSEMAGPLGSPKGTYDPRTPRGSTMRKSTTIIFGKDVGKSRTDTGDCLDLATGPNPLWEVINAGSIDMTRLKEVIIKYPQCVNSALDRAQGIPSALFYGVAMRLPEMVELLVDCRADVCQKHNGHKPWQNIRPGQTPMEVNQSQKLEYLGTPVYDRCEAIAQLMAAEQDRLRSWEGGRRISCQKASQRYFSSRANSFCDDFNRLNLSEVQQFDQKAKQEMVLETLLEDAPESILAKKVIYTAEATCIIQHISNDPNNAFEFGEETGIGTFGTVYASKCLVSGLVRAIKTVPKEFLEDSDIWQEIKVMREMSHPCVARLLATYEDAENIHMVMENCAGGELFQLLDSLGNLPQPTAATMFQQMLSSVNYIHSKKVCHRDLKPENFLLSWDLESQRDVLVKLIDFGTAKCYSETPMTTKICTIHYVAPEILVRGEVVYDEKCDIWSLGCCIFLMICGTWPFCGDDDTTVIKLVRKGKFKFEPAEFWQETEDVQDLISQLLVVDAKQRFSACQALQHRWFLSKLTPPKSTLSLEEVIRRLLAYLKLSWFQQASLELLASHFPQDQIDDLRPLWFDIDKRHVGKISRDDLERAIEADIPEDFRGLEEQRLQAALFQRMQEDPKGEVGYTSFIAAMLDTERRRNEAVCKSAFRELDLDNDNFIRMTELNILYQAAQQQKAGGTEKAELSSDLMGAENGSNEACEKVLQLYDRDKDEALSFSEFMLVVGEDTLR